MYVILYISESSNSSGTLISSNTNSSSSSSFQDAITTMASKFNKSRKSRLQSSDSDSSSQGSTSSASAITSDTDIKLKAVKKRPIPPPPKFKPTLPQFKSQSANSAPTNELDKKKPSSRKGFGKAPAPPSPPPPPTPPIPQQGKGDMSVQSAYKTQPKSITQVIDRPLKDTSYSLITTLKKHQRQQVFTKSLCKKRQSQEDLNDLATVAKRLYTGTPTGVSPRHNARVQKTHTVIESPKAVYV